MICKSNRIVLALVILLNGSWHDTLAHIQYYFPFISIEDWPHYSPSIPTVFNPHKAPAQASYRKTTNKKVIQIRNGTEDKPVQRLACLQPDYSCFLFGQEESKHDSPDCLKTCWSRHWFSSDHSLFLKWIRYCCLLIYVSLITHLSTIPHLPSFINALLLWLNTDVPYSHCHSTEPTVGSIDDWHL